MKFVFSAVLAALAIGGSVLIDLCRAAAENAKIPVAVHLDHCPGQREIITALFAGIGSVMGPYLTPPGLAFERLDLAFGRSPPDF